MHGISCMGAQRKPAPCPCQTIANHAGGGGQPTIAQPSLRPLTRAQPRSAPLSKFSPAQPRSAPLRPAQPCSAPLSPRLVTSWHLQGTPRGAPNNHRFCCPATPGREGLNTFRGKNVVFAWEGLKKHTFHKTSLQHAFGVHCGSILEAHWKPKCSKMETKRDQKGCWKVRPILSDFWEVLAGWLGSEGAPGRER